MANFASPADAILGLTRSVTKDWTKQRKAEERAASARESRNDRLIYRVPRKTFKAAAGEVMAAAYAKASGDGKYPANARQIMYAARPEILRMTGKDKLKDAYFTQTLLVDYIEAHPRVCANWDVVWDARGAFTEPHTEATVPLGTLEVRRYLAEQPVQPSISFPQFNDDYPTVGPENRYDTVLLVEKEGFDPLWQSVRLADRRDIAMMSTKGLSTTAARELIDKLMDRGVQRILVLHDFDVSGFTIVGTLGTTSRRYAFRNKASVIDLGLRLEDVQEMSLESEPVSVYGDWDKRARTLHRHGATDDEIAFLRGRRVELNAMTSPQLVAFVEGKLDELGVKKFVPDNAVLEQQAREVLQIKLLEEAIERIGREIQEKARSADLPEDLRDQVIAEFAEHPALSWDAAVALIMRRREVTA